MSEPRILTREQVRAVDQIAIEQYGLPGIALMENAGRGCVDLLYPQVINGPVVICCGGGNNGGDGFVMARHLENRGIDIRVLVFADPAKIGGDAATNLQVLQHAGTPLVVNPDQAILAEELNRAGWVIDALLGTGMSGAVRSPLREVIETINAANKLVMAIDIPSGMDCNTGKPLGCCVRANITATFVALKPGFLQESAQTLLGDIHVVDIGVPIHLLTSLDAAQE